MDVENQVEFLIFIPFYVKRLVFLFLLFPLEEINLMYYFIMVVFFLYNHLKHFFEIVKDKNKLLKAVYSDLQIKSYLCGCRALGLINKFVTGPLWRSLEFLI